MSDKPKVPALDGWFTMDEGQPHLIGSQCTSCGTYAFPPQKIKFCRNPDCESESFDSVQLSRTGKLWSFTNACYKPPAPFNAEDPFVPYTIAAVELDNEKMIVLGQAIKGIDVADLKAGMDMELVLEPLFEDEDDVKMTWKWKPTSQTTQ